MTEIFYYVCEFVYTAVMVWEIFNLIRSLENAGGADSEKRGIRIAAAAVIAGIKVYIVMQENNVDSSLLFLIFSALTALAARAADRSKLSDSFLVGSVFWGLLILGDFFLQAVIYVTFFENWAPDCLLMLSVQRGVYLLIWAGFAAGLSYYLTTTAKTYIKAIFRHRGWMWGMNGILIVCLFYFQQIYRFDVSGNYFGRWWLFLVGFVLLGMIGAGYSVGLREKQNSRLLQMKIELLENNYQQILKERSEKSILVHDMKNHLLAISKLAEMGKNAEISEYIGRMYPVLAGKQKCAVTNHLLLDLILDCKVEEAAKKGIEAKLESDDMSGLLLSEMEVSALFSNLLDNAIEANERRNAEGGWINIRCKQRNRMLVINMSNPTDRMIAGDVLPRTSKEDKTIHGLGMLSIQQVVDTYSGYMEYHTENDEFRMMICLSAFDI